MNPLKQKIKNQALILVIILGIIAFLFLFFQTRYWSRINYNNIVKTKLNTVIIVARDFLDEDYHDNIQNPDSVSADEYTRIVKSFNKFCTDLDISYIWSVLEIDNKIVFTTATTPSHIYNEMAHARFFELHTNPEIYRQVIKTGQATQIQITDKWGELESLLIPFTDANGRHYVFGAALDSSKFKQQAMNCFISQLSGNFLIILFILFIAYMLIRLLIRPLSFIIYNIQAIASGDYDIKKTNWASEYHELAKNINFMYSEINNSYNTIKQQEKDLRTTLMCIGEGVIVTDYKGIITRINNEALKLAGWEKQDALGKPIRNVFNIYNIKNTSKPKFTINNVLLSGQSAELGHNIMLISKDNTEYHITGIIAPIISNKSVTGAVVSFQNLTTEDLLIAKIRQNHEIMLEILRISKIGYWEYNVEDHAFWVSREIVELYGIEEIDEGHINDQLFYTRYIENSSSAIIAVKDITDAINTNRPFRSVHEITNQKTGQKLFLDAAAIPILNPQGNVEKLVGLTKDITEYKAISQQLYHSQRLDAVGQLAGGVAHDFNNMLGGIIGFTELLLKNLDDDKLIEYCNSIISTSENAAKLTSRLLSFARKGKNLSTPISLHNTINSAISLLRRSIDKQISISTDLTAVPDTIVGDPSQLESVIINLGINSRDAIQAKGRIKIITRTTEFDSSFCKDREYDIEPGNYIEISVIDDGSGIDKDTLTHIFEPFFTTKKEGEGTGLGLSVINGIITSHNGFIDVSSEPGTGTEFKIYLPLCSNTSEAETLKETTESNLSGHEQILLVDDEDVIRNMAKAILEDLGYTVIIAETGRSALEIYQEQMDNISVVILDVVMPEMGGMETLTKLIQLDSEVKVIIASGYSRDETEQDFLNAGAVDFIHKPYRQLTFAHAIKKALKK